MYSHDVLYQLLYGKSQEVFFSMHIDALVLPLHTESQLHCQTPNNTYSHTWRLNRIVIASNSTFPDVARISSQTFTNGSTQGILTLTAHAQVNNTVITCFITNGVHYLPQLDYNIVIQGMPNNIAPVVFMTKY